MGTDSWGWWYCCEHKLSQGTLVQDLLVSTLEAEMCFQVSISYCVYFTIWYWIKHTSTELLWRLLLSSSGHGRCEHRMLGRNKYDQLQQFWFKIAIMRFYAQSSNYPYGFFACLWSLLHHMYVCDHCYTTCMTAHTYASTQNPMTMAMLLHMTILFSWTQHPAPIAT